MKKHNTYQPMVAAARSGLTLKLLAATLGLGVAAGAQAVVQPISNVASISVADATVVQPASGNATLSFQVTATRDPNNANTNLVIPYTVAPVSAQPNVDYTPPATDAVLRIPAGQTTATIQVPVLPGAPSASSKTLSLSLGQAAAFTDPPGFESRGFVSSPAKVGYAANAATAATAIDIYSDGHPGLASVVAGDTHVYVTPQSPTTGFQLPGTAIDLGKPLTAIASADFDGDGKPDLAVVGEQSWLFILINQGDGSFKTGFASQVGPTSSFSYPASWTELISADFNGDGQPDLATTDDNGNVVVLLNSGFGIFNNFTVANNGYTATGLVSADFNGDHKADLAEMTNDGTTFVQLGKGDGSFSATIPAVSTGNYSAGGYAPVISVDLNGDGYADLVETFPTDSRVWVFMGKGDGRFGAAQTVYKFGRPPTAVVSADFNGDGKPDLAVLDTYSNKVYLLPNNGDGTFGSPTSFAISGAVTPTALISADFNNDGKPDLVVTDASANAGSFWRNSPYFGASISRAQATGTLQSANTPPNPFSFASVTGAHTGALVSSAVVAITGNSGSQPISISGGQYSIIRNGVAAPFTSAAGSLLAGDQVQVQLLTASKPSTLSTATLTIGGVSGSFRVTTLSGDDIPDAFSFSPLTGIPVNTVRNSNTINPSGFNVPVPVSISGGAYSINGGAFTTAAGTLKPGQTITVQVRSSSSPGATVTAVLSLGNVSGSFSVTTQPGSSGGSANSTVNGFSFSPLTGIPVNTVRNSNAINPSGFNVPVPVSISGGAYSINGGAFTTAAGTLKPGQTITVQLTSAATGNTTKTATLKIGSTVGSFSVTTQASSTGSGSGSSGSGSVTVNNVSFSSMSGIPANTLKDSNTVNPIINGASSVPVTISGGTYSINNGLFTASVGTLRAGDLITVRAMSSATSGQTVTVTLKLGSQSFTYQVTTQ